LLDYIFDMINMLSQEVPEGHSARRKSVDVGGLSLALENKGLGHGWGGWEEGEMSESGCDLFFFCVYFR
jgi:hypothetical protein